MSVSQAEGSHWESRVEIRCGDAMAELAKLPDASVQMVMTSPPYWGLRDYATGTWEGGDVDCDHGVRRWEGAMQTQGAQSGHAAQADRLNRRQCGRCGAVRVDQQIGSEATLAEYLAGLVAVFREVRRVLRKDGTVWLNMGDAYAQGGKRATAAELAGDRERAEARGYGTEAYAGYPGWQRAAGTIGGGVKEKDLLMMPHRLALALQADGWWVRSDIVWAKGNPMPESVRDRPTRAHEYLFLLSKSPRYFYDGEAIREAGVCPAGTRGAKGSAARQAVPGVNARPPEYKMYDGQRNKRSVWSINSRPFKGAHFATFPPALVRPCLRAGSSERGCCPACGAPWVRETVEAGRQKAQNGPGTCRKIELAQGKHGRSSLLATGTTSVKKTTGWRATCNDGHEPVPCTVLDPFAGSGTVGEVAWQEGRRAVLIELSPEYCDLIRARLDAAARRPEHKGRGKRAWQQLTLPDVASD